MRVALLGAIALAASIPGVAHADGPPPAVYLVEAIGNRNEHTLGLADLAAGTTTDILKTIPMGVQDEIAVDAATRRWAITFQQGSNGDPLFLDGKVLSEPLGVHAIVTGQLDTPGIVTLGGDPACHAKKRACFETAIGFVAGGQLLVTRSEGSSWWMWNQRALTAGAKPSPVVDKALARSGNSLAIGSDGKRAVYLGRKSDLWVTAWPAPAAVAKPPKVKAAKKRVAAPPLVMSEPSLVGDHIFYFRRNPDDQSGLIAAWDLVRSTEIEVFRFPDSAPLWRHRFLHAPSRGSVFFQHDASFERADLYEVSLTTWQVKKVGTSVRKLLDVSGDGRYLLCAAYAEPDAAKRKVFDQYLVVIDADTGKEARRLTLPYKLPRLHDARFVAAKP
jgi:hypothetical protein